MKKLKKNEREIEDYEIKFWKDWLNADSLKRLEMTEKLPIIQNIWNIKDLPLKLRNHSFVSMLNGFFEDLESAVYTKIRLENKKNERKD